MSRALSWALCEQPCRKVGTIAPPIRASGERYAAAGALGWGHATLALCAVERMTLRAVVAGPWHGRWRWAVTS